jgi:hypothetical protein
MQAQPAKIYSTEAQPQPNGVLNDYDVHFLLPVEHKLTQSGRFAVKFI